MSSSGIAAALPKVPTSPAVAQNAADSYTAKGDVLGTDIKSQISGALADMQAREKKADDLEASLDPNALKPPVLQPMPKAEQTDPIKEWGSAAMAIASLGGLFTRTPLITSLKAASGVLNAYKTRDSAAAQTAFDSWKIANQNAIDAAKWSVDAYKDAIEQIKTDRDGGKAELMAVASALKDETIPYMLQHYGPATTTKLIADQERQITAMEKAAPDIEIRHNQAQNGLAVMDAQNGLAQAQQSKDPAKIAAAQAVLQSATQRAQSYNAATSKRGAGAGGGGDLTPEGETLAATMFAQTGQMPSLGMGGGPIRVKIINDAAKLLTDSGVNPADAVAGQADVKAARSALTKVSTLSAVSSGQEKAALKAMSLAESLMDKGAGTDAGSVVNRWLQAGKQATGDPDVAAFNTAIDTFTNEYAKIITGSTSATGATDASRREAADMLSKFGSPEQMKAQMAVMEKDMGYKVDSWSQTKDLLHKNIAGTNVGGMSPAKIDAAISQYGIDGALQRATTDPERMAISDRYEQTHNIGPDRKQAKADPSWPSPQGHANGSKLKDASGKVVATVKDGKWVPQ